MYVRKPRIFSLPVLVLVTAVSVFFGVYVWRPAIKEYAANKQSKEI